MGIAISIGVTVEVFEDQAEEIRAFTDEFSSEFE